MKIFKFGGASVNTADRIKQVGAILQSYNSEKILIVISAMGKTTNALEEIVKAFYNKEKEKALSLFNKIKGIHISLANELSDQPMGQLNDLFTEVEWLLHDKPVKGFDYYYDQVVCVGELLSTAIISNYLNAVAIKNKWIDVRDIIRTDDNFRDAKIDWLFTNSQVQNVIAPLFYDYDFIITQGFIGSTDENESTTLGREGSDYTAAVFANLLDAQSQTIWKDVKGVMNADPKLYDKAIWIKELNYKEVIEMAYYGAQVIHPKTIKPLQNKNIPLYVKSFIHPGEEGTAIHNKNIQQLPSIIVHKHNQVLIEISSKDYSFTDEGLTDDVNKLFHELRLRQNLTQITAISMLCVVDDHADKIENFCLAASEHFEVQITKGLTLLTIRHYQREIMEELIDENLMLVRQQTPTNIQVLIKS
jgi:aspartate kinase